MMSTVPKVSEAYRLFAQEERHKEISQLSSNTESLDFVAENKRFNDHQANKGFRPLTQPFFQKQPYQNYNQNHTGQFRPAFGNKRPSQITIAHIQDTRAQCG